MLNIHPVHCGGTSKHGHNPGGADQSIKAEGLPFTIRLAGSSIDMEKAIRMRHAAYMRHVPGFAQSLSVPESADVADGVVILLAESKLDGSCVGTMRIQTNDYTPLSLEKSLQLPPHLHQQRLAEATRLGVINDRGGRMVTTALFKAFYMYCKENEVDWMVITARSPVDRQYDRLMFKDVYPELGYIPVEHVGNLLHRVMCLQVNAVHGLWGAALHPLFNFFFKTVHEDIDVLAQTECTKQNFSRKLPEHATVLAGQAQV